jgi:hypothetical protein
VVIVALASVEEDRDVQVASVIAPRLEIEEDELVGDEEGDDESLGASDEEGSTTSDSAESGVDGDDSDSD